MTSRYGAANGDPARSTRRRSGPAVPPSSEPPYVVGPGNRAAHDAARDFVRAPSPGFNTLLLLGGHGAGKTHLLRTSHRAAVEHLPGRPALLATCGEFVSQFCLAIQENRVCSFRRKYRSAEILFLDDVDGLAHKGGCQDELLHTLKAYDGTGRRVVVTSSALPSRVAGMHRALAARLAGGLACELKPPDYATRLAILQARAARLAFPPTADLLSAVARQPSGSPGELVRLLDRVAAYRNPSLTTIEAALRELVGPEANPLDLEAVEGAVSAFFKMSGEELRSQDRRPGAVLPRQICLYLARTLTSSSLESVGRRFGGKSHTTVLHACRRVERLCSKDEQVRQQVERLRAKLGGLGKTPAAPTVGKGPGSRGDVRP
ncbi:MAG: hypothetical protein HYZ53_22635 [Planctomycetes bacterium]|nr:hypothetical protein [Planctomycetota bacterium]